MKLIHIVSGTAILAGAIAAATASQPASKANPLRVSMIAAGNGTVELDITNMSNHTVRMPKWELPSNDAESKLFNVSRDGEAVQYLGKQVKRSDSKFLPSDFVVLKAGQTYRAVVDLSASYDMAKSGQYSVTYVAPLQFASLSNGVKLENDGLPMVAQSAPLSLWVEGKAAPQPAGDVTTLATEAFVGCSTSQQSSITTALNSARTYSENAKGYLAAGTTGARYTTWFGSYTSARYATVSQHFVAIDDALDNKPVTVNCGCSSSSYAYVYSNKPYEIFVCNAFWSAPNTGTDSRAGTLIHEMSHFDVVAGTDDVVYGQAGAKKLALRQPTKAVKNADSHEYFAENTPFQN